MQKFENKISSELGARFIATHMSTCQQKVNIVDRINNDGVGRGATRELEEIMDSEPGDNCDLMTFRHR